MATTSTPPPERPTKAFVTLITSDSYLAGALTAINSVLDVEGSKRRDEYETVCLVTPSTVGQGSIKALQKVFDQVVGVAEITTRSWHELELLGRKDLAASLTKLHLWRLTQYNKVIFLDADTLVLRPITSLFDLDVDFAAAPDSGWPDSFNSGVMLATPSAETFDSLIKLMDEKGTWDGGDQGLLNDFFPNWHRLTYTFNVTPSAYYTYAPAFRRHGHNVNVLHFIGKNKPWKRGTRGTYVVEDEMKDYYNLVGLWYDVYERHYGNSLTYDVASKVVAPPSFQSLYTSLAPHHSSSSKPYASTSSAMESSSGRTTPPKLEWDPAVNPPPSSSHQMREAITTHYDSVWDDPSTRKQKIRFQPPSSYPNIPASTHEWYKDVMSKKPDPSAVRPVFPWEEPKVSTRPSQPPSPVKAPSRTFPPSPPQNEPASTGFQPRQGYQNAWDSVPGINRYAKSLAKATKKRQSSVDANAESRGSSETGSALSTPTSLLPGGSGTTSFTGLDHLGGRKSSLKEPTPYQSRSDASSRDGDDEDEDETNSSSEDEDGADRPKIPYRRSESVSSRTSQTSQTHSPSGSVSPSHTRSRSGSSGGETGDTTPLASLSGGATSPVKHRRPPTSPRATRAAVEPTTHHQHHHQPAHHTSAPAKSSFRLNPAPAGHTAHAITHNGSNASSLPLTSPRLAAQAIRNSTAARLTSAGAGVGDGPPVVRATRVFSPETDTGVVKQQGLAALQRFVENFEASQAAGSNGPPAAEGSTFSPKATYGGAGSAGHFRW